MREGRKEGKKEEIRVRKEEKEEGREKKRGNGNKEEKRL